MLDRRTFAAEALALVGSLAGSRAHAFVPPQQGKGRIPEDPMVTVPSSSGPIPAPSTVAAAPPDAEVTATGLRSKLLRAGSGARPSASDTVIVHYTGWTTDGKMFDSSVLRKAPATFPLNALIKGFAEGLQLMRVGEQRRLWIPGPLAYGDVAKPGRPTGILVFDVELIAIKG